MLYYILKYLSRLTIRIYFRRKSIIGKENIPDNVPVIFVANHPSAFMDPMLIATYVHQSIYFLAAGEYVGTGIRGWIFRKMLHMIPVFRPSTRPDDVHKNKQMFEHCYKHLSAGGHLMVFPEGVSVTQRKILPFKTGVARIARGAEIKNNFKLNIHIVPVGLNYSDPHQFRSDVFINIGKPIRVNDFISKDEKNEAHDIDLLTSTAEKALYETTLHVENDDDDKLLTQVDAIYTRDLKDELGIQFTEQVREFNVQKEMVNAIRYFREHNPVGLDNLAKQVENYLTTLKNHGLSDEDIHDIQFSQSFRRIGIFIFGFPIFFIGVLLNAIPWFLTQFILKKLRFKDSFQGSVAMGAGLIVFTLYYLVGTLVLFFATPLSWWALLFPGLAYIFGVYAQIYRAAINYSIHRKRLRKLLKADQRAAEKLAEQRELLILQCEEFRAVYEKSQHD